MAVVSASAQGVQEILVAIQSEATQSDGEGGGDGLEAVQVMEGADQSEE